MANSSFRHGAKGRFPTCCSSSNTGTVVTVVGAVQQQWHWTRSANTLWHGLNYENMGRVPETAVRQATVNLWLHKLTVPQLVRTFPAFCGTWRFIVVLTTARYLPVLSQ